MEAYWSYMGKADQCRICYLIATTLVGNLRWQGHVKMNNATVHSKE